MNGECVRFNVMVGDIKDDGAVTVIMTVILAFVVFCGHGNLDSFL